MNDLISVVMPYWQRKEATDRSIAVMERLYPILDLEVVVVDDGSPEPYTTSRAVHVVRLPAKREARNPCVPLNKGVAEARGDILVLTSPEIVHRTPILGEMCEELRRRGSMAYVQAAVWCPDEGRWHSHSSVAGKGDTPMPYGACLHFLCMLTRELWAKTGGFEEVYRAGAGYEDNDFAWKLAKAGAIFVSRDDLIADHPHTTPRSRWLPGAHSINRRLFEERWAC